MKAAVLTTFHKPLAIREIDISEPGFDEVTVEVKAVGLCLTDVHISEGKIPTVKLPLVPGHEFAGVVAKKGANVDHVDVGDRVTVNIDVTCGRCEFCLVGETNRCVHLIRIGFERNGGMEEYVNVPAANVEKISEDVPFEKAAIIPDAVSTMYRALKTLGEVTAGTKVAILGIGGLGMQGIKIAKLLGAHVTCTSRNERKLEMAKSLGADVVINTGRDKFLDVVRNSIGCFDIVVDNIGIRQSIQDSVAACKNGGRVVVVGYVEQQLEAPFYDIVIREKQIVGSRAATRSEFRDVVSLVNTGQLDPDIGELIPISQINQALENLNKGKYLTRSVLTLPFG
ncbi:MAG: alcohol dehydrogenase catalytic domain-containing protein [Thermodesulfobacteriota bacterium]